MSKTTKLIALPVLLLGLLFFSQLALAASSDDYYWAKDYYRSDDYAKYYYDSDSYEYYDAKELTYYERNKYYAKDYSHYDHNYDYDYKYHDNSYNSQYLQYHPYLPKEHQDKYYYGPKYYNSNYDYEYHYPDRDDRYYYQDNTNSYRTGTAVVYVGDNDRYDRYNNYRYERNYRTYDYNSRYRTSTYTNDEYRNKDLGTLVIARSRDVYVDDYDYKLKYSSITDKSYLTKCYSRPPRNSLIYVKC